LFYSDKKIYDFEKEIYESDKEIYRKVSGNVSGLLMANCELLRSKRSMVVPEGCTVPANF
jgi:hypothetical protein